MTDFSDSDEPTGPDGGASPADPADTPVPPDGGAWPSLPGSAPTPPGSAPVPPNREGWGGAAPAARRRPRWYQRPLPVAAVVAATVAAGIGVGHVAWPAGAASRASAAGSSTGGSGGVNPFSGSPPGGTGSVPGGTGSNGRGSSGSAPSGGPSDVGSIAAEVDPALVDINVTFAGQSPGAGTGIVLTSDGEVLTNNHVVEGATAISVTDIGNGRTYAATVVGYDATADVAVIQLTNASGLQTAKLGDSAHLAVGDGVVAIGNAGGTGGTPTATGGSITALDQAITASDQLSGASENLTGLIETDADIQPGDSGGSLVNTSGQVIGIDTAATGGYALSSKSNQGYAIPIGKARSIASQIEAGHASSSVHVGPTAYLGVLVSSAGSASPGESDPFGSSTGGSGASGALIEGVVGGGPAAQAGLAQGDLITSLDGHEVTSASDLTTVLQRETPGDQVQLGWTDTDGAAHSTTVTLGAGPAQ